MSTPKSQLFLKQLLGNCWLKLPTLTRWDNNCLQELSHNRRFYPIRNSVLPVLLRKANQENSGGAKMREEIPAHRMSQPPRNLQARIHFGWKMHVRQGRTLSRTKCEHKQEDWPETTLKANGINIKPEPWQSSSPWFPNSATFHMGMHTWEVSSVCLTLCDPVDCSPPGSSVYAILQARELQWVVFPFSRGSSQPIEPAYLRFPELACGFFTTSATGKPLCLGVSLPDKVVCFIWRCVSLEISFLSIRW